ncbi:NAD(P)-binding domain-containing protein, partial [Microvirga sp. P5_D2]
MPAEQLLNAPADVASLLERFTKRQAKIGIIGLGYVGLPLALTAAKAGFTVLGFDINASYVERLNRGESYIRHIPEAPIKEAVAERRLEATTDFARLGEPDAILICVPTPLTKHREPDLSYVENTARTIAAHLRKG